MGGVNQRRTLVVGYPSAPSSLWLGATFMQTTMSHNIRLLVMGFLILTMIGNPVLWDMGVSTPSMRVTAILYFSAFSVSGD